MQVIVEPGKVNVKLVEFLLQVLVVGEKVGHLHLSVGGDLHFEICTGILNLGASCAVGGKLHCVGVDFDFGSKVGGINPGGETAGYGVHKLADGGSAGGVRCYLCDLDAGLFLVDFAVIEDFYRF